MTRSETAAARRTLGVYRRLVLLGKVSLPLAEARKLVGPDCAYHLYFRHEGRLGSRSGRGRRGR